MSTFHEITVDLTYHPMRLPTPRHRKLRPVPTLEKVTVKVPVYTDSDAPVVARVPEGAMPGIVRWDTSELRHDGRRFYAKEVDYQGNPIVGLPDKVEEDIYTQSLPEATSRVIDSYAGTVLINGEVWQHVSEPVYTVYTMGLGANHGGTGMDARFLDDAKHRTSADRIFSILEPETAIEGAVKVALDRGDTESVPRIRAWFKKIEVIDPSVFKVPTTAQRDAQARKQVESLLDDVARMVTSGTISRDVLDQAEEIIKQAQGVMWDHGITSIER